MPTSITQAVHVLTLSRKIVQHQYNYWLTSDLCQVDYAIDVYKQLHSDEEDPPEPQGNVHLKDSSHFTNTPSNTYIITHTPSRIHHHTRRDDRSEEGGGGEAPWVWADHWPHCAAVWGPRGAGVRREQKVRRPETGGYLRVPFLNPSIQNSLETRSVISSLEAPRVFREVIIIVVHLSLW